MERAKTLMVDFPPRVLKKHCPDLKVCSAYHADDSSILEYCIGNITPVIAGLVVSAVSVIAVWSNRESILDDSKVFSLFRFI
jgi:hypothetical protein